jgi:hypothetical protein
VADYRRQLAAMMAKEAEDTAAQVGLRFRVRG